MKSVRSDSSWRIKSAQLNFIPLSVSKKTPPCLLQIVNNGGRPEIALQTPKQRQSFESFVKYAVRDLDADIQKKTLEYVSYQDGETLRAFSRYFYEGWLKQKASKEKIGYRSDGLTPQVLKDLLKISKFKNLHGIDFGCGNGEVLATLTELGALATGFDLGPFFIQDVRNLGLNARMCEIDQRPELFQQEFKLNLFSQDFVIATLVLDRLKNPTQFLQNFFQALKSGGKFALQTLLPIIPQDDGPVQNPILYTSSSQQITPGRSFEGDKQALLELLQKQGGTELRVISFPYSVKSLDGVQNYQLWSFNGVKK